MNITRRLLEQKDVSYKEFNSKLIPTVNKDTVIGVRTPVLRKLAKELYGTKEAEEFIHNLPHKYFEENNLHGFLIERMKNYDECIKELNIFLPYVDNWATCDQITPKVFKKHLPELFEQIKIWIKSQHTYTVRFSIKLLMSFYLDEHFDKRYADLVASVKSDEYYIKMMTAWYFATALAKQYEAVLSYIENNRLEVWEHNKTIQKAIESHRITDEQKMYLKTLKR